MNSPIRLTHYVPGLILFLMIRGCVFFMPSAQLKGEELPRVHVEITQGASNSIQLVQLGNHDFTAPLRFPVDANPADCVVKLRRGNLVIEQITSIGETTETDGKKSFNLIISPTVPTTGILEYEVRLSIKNQTAPLFRVEYIADLDTSHLTREFSITNNSILNWGQPKGEIRLVLCDDASLAAGVPLLDTAVNSIPIGTTTRYVQVLSAELESGVAMLDPLVATVGDLPKTLLIRNGFFPAGANHTRAIIRETDLKLRSKLAVPENIISRSVRITPEIPLGTPHEIQSACPCSENKKRTASSRLLKIGTEPNLHVVDTSEGEPEVWLPIDVSEESIRYFVAKPITIRVANSGANERRLRILPNANLQEMIFLNHGDFLIKSGSEKLLGSSKENGLWAVTTKLEKLNKPTDVLELSKWQTLARSLAENTKALKANYKQLLLLYCSNPDSAKLIGCKSETEFKSFLDGMEELLNKIGKPSELLSKMTELEKNQNARRKLVAMRRELLDSTSDENWRELLRLNSRFEELIKEEERLRSNLSLLKARLIWSFPPGADSKFHPFDPTHGRIEESLVSQSTVISTPRADMTNTDPSDDPFTGPGGDDPFWDELLPAPEALPKN